MDDGGLDWRQALGGAQEAAVTLAPAGILVHGVLFRRRLAVLLAGNRNRQVEESLDMRQPVAGFGR